MTPRSVSDIKPVLGSPPQGDKVRLARAAEGLLDALEKACVLLDRIRDACEYEDGSPVTLLEARDIEIIHGDAVTELPAIKDLLRRLGKAA